MNTPNDFGNTQMTDDQLSGVLKLISSIVDAHNLHCSIIIPDQSGHGLHVASVMCKDCHAKFLRAAADLIETGSNKTDHGPSNELIK